MCAFREFTSAARNYFLRLLAKTTRLGLKPLRKAKTFRRALALGWTMRGVMITRLVFGLLATKP